MYSTRIAAEQRKIRQRVQLIISASIFVTGGQSISHRNDQRIYRILISLGRNKTKNMENKKQQLFDRLGGGLSIERESHVPMDTFSSHNEH